MKILMTGANGFIGTLLRLKFKATDWQVVPFEGNLLNPSDLSRFLNADTKWDFIVHLAGISAVPYCEQNEAEAYQMNTTATCMLVDAIKKYSPQAQLIFASSGQVYDLLHGVEKPVTEAHEICPSNVYSRTKRAAELYIQDTFKSFNGSYVILRVFNHSHKSQRPDFFMPSIYQQIMGHKESGELVLKVGNIRVQRDIGAMQDLIEAFYVLLNQRIDGQEIFNLSSGTGKELLSIINVLSEKLKKQVKIEVCADRVRKDDPPIMIASVEKLSRCYGWSPNHAKDENALVAAFLADIQ